MTAYLGTDDVNSYIVATTPQPDMAVAPNFERFSGLEGSPELDHPASGDGAWNSGSDYGMTPRPGQLSQPVGQTYTKGPLQGTVGVIGGQPLPVRAWESADDSAATRGYTPSKTPSIQHRLGDGQNFQGLAQTVILSELTQNPPQPGDLTSILAGQA
jgi:hypothetical protein